MFFTPSVENEEILLHKFKLTVQERRPVISELAKSPMVTLGELQRPYGRVARKKSLLKETHKKSHLHFVTSQQGASCGESKPVEEGAVARRSKLNILVYMLITIM
ncbi:hypothetical protein ILYODFUR_015518 [Ilyodon furcidens]|uniref:Uncharacterized protein n=1 Tax=Ilyodon furcidens TaxID=33524 RepID=A0ABV0V397_9TELE